MWYKLWCRTVWIKLLKKPDVFPLSSRRLPENLRLKLFRWACQKKGIILACCAWSICVTAQWTSLWECYLPGEKVSQTLYDTDSNWTVSQWVHEICNHRGDRARCVDPVPSLLLPDHSKSFQFQSLQRKWHEQNSIRVCSNHSHGTLPKLLKRI